MWKFDVDDIKSRYDMRSIYPASPRRRLVGGGTYILDRCVFHDDAKPSMLVNQGRYQCRACGEWGDVVAWTMRQENCDFTEACRRLTDGLTFLSPLPPPHAPLPPPHFEIDEHQAYVAGMTADDYTDFSVQTGITIPTMQSFLVGRYDFGIFTIPIPDPDTGEVIDIKLYRPKTISDQIKYWHLRANARQALFGVERLNGESFAVIVGGEKDCIRGHQEHLPAVTQTAGEMAWQDEFNRHFSSRTRVYVWQDSDLTGRRGTMRIWRSMPRAIPCDWRTLWDPYCKKGYDLSDYFNEGGTTEWLLEMLHSAERGLGGQKPLKPELVAKGLIPIM